MRIVFISNYLNHHQLPLCNAFINMDGIEFHFVAVEAISLERLRFGYSDIDSQHEFVLRAYKNKEEEKKAVEVMKKADVLISGVNHREYLSVKDMEGKLIFLYLERTFRKIRPDFDFLIKVFRTLKNHTLNRNQHTYVLCAGAYVAVEFKKFCAYKGRMYKWGYFPKVIVRDREEAIRQKGLDGVKILWVGRLLNLKRPKQALVVTKELKHRGYDVKLDIIGGGELEDEIKEQIRCNHLESCVRLLKSMPADEVRKYMDQADIFLFTSNREEGWGAVLNEAMNSRCAVVANRWIGSVPFLIEDEKNGLIYDGTVEELFVKTESLVKDRQKRLELGEQAYHTMVACWNADVAASNLVQLSQRLLMGEKNVKDIEGPCGYIG